MADRFIEVICEIVGQKSPEEIREEELNKLISKHLSDYSKEEFTKTDLIYKKIYNNEISPWDEEYI